MITTIKALTLTVALVAPTALVLPTTGKIIQAPFTEPKIEDPRQGIVFLRCDKVLPEFVSRKTAHGYSPRFAMSTPNGELMAVFSKDKNPHLSAMMLIALSEADITPMLQQDFWKVNIEFYCYDGEVKIKVLWGEQK